MTSFLFQALTFFDTHFSSLQSAVAAFAPSRILTPVRSEHVSFSDLPVLIPRKMQAADERCILLTICVLADAFLRRAVQLDGPPEELGVPGVTPRRMEVTWEGEGKQKRKRLVGEEGDVVVH
jgi:platelet-activating factor acetylhydrolase